MYPLPRALAFLQSVQAFLQRLFRHGLKDVVQRPDRKRFHGIGLAVREKYLRRMGGDPVDLPGELHARDSGHENIQEQQVVARACDNRFQQLPAVGEGIQSMPWRHATEHFLHSLQIEAVVIAYRNAHTHTPPTGSISRVTKIRFFASKENQACPPYFPEIFSIRLSP